MDIKLSRAFLRCLGLGSMTVMATCGAAAAAADEENQLVERPGVIHLQLAAAEQPVQSAASEPSGPRVYLEAAVGRVTLGDTGESPGKKRFAARSQLAGSGTLVSFSTTPVRDQIADAPVAAGQFPLVRARLSSGFGVTRLSAGGGTRAHAGVDLAAPAGSPVSAAYDGRVAVADWRGSYGLLVVLEHGNGMQTRYAHLSRLGVAEGQVVKQGQVLGFVGSTGRSTGPHLHYEVRKDGRPVNPLAR